MDDADREAADAPRSDADDAARADRERRKGLWLLLLAVAGGGVGGLVGFWLLTSSPPPPPPAPPPPPTVAVVEPPPPPPPPVVEPAPPPPPKTRRVATSTPTPAPSKKRAGTVVISSASGGDTGVRKALVRAFTSSLSRLDVRQQSDSGYAITVIVDDQKHSGDDVTVKCAITVAQLPQKKVLASLKARADASGEGTDVDELFDDAASACGQSLGKDLTAYIEKHPL